MSTTLRIIMAQLDFCVGDIKGNTQRIIKAIQQARDELQGDLIVFPELALCGYPSEDLLLRGDFQTQIVQGLTEIKQHVTGIDVVLSYPHHEQGQLYNSASVIRAQAIIATYHKQCLPNYGVFDEQRYFVSGSEPCIFTLKNVPISILICEDIWHPQPIAQALQAGARLVLSPNASPFDANKAAQRLQVLQQRVAEAHIPILYTHLVGGQDDLVFDGGSMAVDATGTICVHGGFFSEQLIPVDIKLAPTLQVIPTPWPLSATESAVAKVYQALVLSVRDYINKNGFSGVLLGLSGGIDSALTLAIAVDALGKERVQIVALPSRYTSELSMQLIAEMVKNIGVQAATISIEAVYNEFLKSLAPEFAETVADKTEENIQARCRGVMLMALSNKTGKLLLTTGNKSEMATGYATLYGDMAGGFAVLKDVYKTLVYQLADYRNQLSPIIPQQVIDRPPTAELAPNQTDQDSLPPYAELDQILTMYIEQDCSLAEIVAAGFAEATVKRMIKMVENNEYKRRQAAIGPRVTARAFGRERRYPITSQFK